MEAGGVFSPKKNPIEVSNAKVVWYNNKSRSLKREIRFTLSPSVIFIPISNYSGSWFLIGLYIGQLEQKDYLVHQAATSYNSSKRRRNDYQEELSEYGSSTSLRTWTLSKNERLNNRTIPPSRVVSLNKLLTFLNKAPFDPNNVYILNNEIPLFCLLNFCMVTGTYGMSPERELHGRRAN